MALSPTEELKVFYSYSHKDQDYRQQLENHLSNLKRLYHLRTWFDREIIPGENWEHVLDEHLNTADLIFLLISPDFMASDYCYNNEMQRALDRHARGEAKVIPIIIRRVHWKDAPFSHIQLLPTDAKPVKSWTDQDEAFYNIALGIEQAIQDLLHSRPIFQPTPATIHRPIVTLHTLQGHTDATYVVAFSPNSQWLASASNDHIVRLWGLP